VTSYDDIGKELIRRFKFDGDQEAGRLCASYMAEVVDAADHDIVVAVTTTAARRRQRGYDQAEILAREIARRLRLPHVKALVRVKNVHQIGRGRLERLAQSEDLYVATNARDITSKRILLVDDVTTTGATMRSAAATLQDAGATDVYCLAFARDE
jgi:competence protein ComFC